MTSEKRRKLLKGAVKWIASTSAGATASAVLTEQLPATDKITKKVLFVIGAGVIGSMVSDSAKDWADGEVDDFFELIDKTKEPSDEDTSEE